MFLGDDDETTAFAFAVTLSTPSAETITVDVATVDHTDIRGLGTARLRLVAELPLSFDEHSAGGLALSRSEDSPCRDRAPTRALDLLLSRSQTDRGCAVVVGAVTLLRSAPRKR